MSGTDVTLAFTDGSAVIRQGQAVTVAYTDPNAGDDARGVVQDDSGNDAADFTLGPGLSVTVVNNSGEAVTAPGAPRKLVAEGAGATSIKLTWDAPVDTGGQAIAGYRIEWSADGSALWTGLADDHNEMTSEGRFEYVDMDMNLEPGTVRHYRVRARNATGLGEPSNVDDGTAVHPDAPDAPDRARGDGERRHAGRRLDADRSDLDEAGGRGGFGDHGATGSRSPRTSTRSSGGSSWRTTP